MIAAGDDMWDVLRAFHADRGTGPAWKPWVSSALPYTPPSVNELPLDTHNPRYRIKRNAWMQDVAHLMVEHGNRLPRQLECVHASALLTFTSSRRRDEGNYRSHIEKWLGDLLQTTQRIQDDTPDHYRFGSVQFAAGAKPSMVLMLMFTASGES